MRELLEQAPDLDAVFVASDLMAAGAIDALHAAGRRVPEDVAVGGFDDSPVATRTDPRSPRSASRWTASAREMVRLLLDVIDGQPPAAVIVPTELVRRESA